MQLHTNDVIAIRNPGAVTATGQRNNSRIAARVTNVYERSVTVVTTAADGTPLTARIDRDAFLRLRRDTRAACVLCDVDTRFLTGAGHRFVALAA